MRSIASLAVFSIFLLACDSKTDNIDLGQSQDQIPVDIGGALPLAEIPAAVVELAGNTEYEWSVRARTAMGDGEWSSGLAFSIHDSEALALANAVDQGDDLDFQPGLYDDGLLVPTVVSYSPTGSILNYEPSFKWLPVLDAESYDVRIVNVDTGESTFTNSYLAEDLCHTDDCQLESFEAQPDSNWRPSAVAPQTVNFNGSPIVVAAEVDSTNPVVTPTDQTDTGGDTTNVVSSEAEEPAPTEPVGVVASVTPDTSTAPDTQLELATASAEQTPEVPQPISANNGSDEEIETLQGTEGVLAFPGALGYAKHATGGRGGRVLTVNTVLNVVDPNDSFLSLREAIEVETGPRTIVFAVGGIFDTGSQNLNLLGEDGSNVTLACQSAPAPGVVIRTYGFNVQNSAHDIVFRHCKIRGVDIGAPGSQAGRSMTIRAGTRNVILDHMSISWTTDEGFQAYLGKTVETGFENITVSNSIVVEGDADSSHPESVEHNNWGYHAMGPSCLNNNENFRPTNCSIVNNFVAHNSSRNVMIWGGAGEMSNNIVYNWYAIGLTAKTYFKNDSDVIVNNNLMKSGPDTEGATSNPSCGPAEYRCAMALGPSDEHGAARYSVGDNYYIPENKTLADAELINNPNASTPDGTPAFDPGTPSPINIRNMAAVGSRHMTCLGASRPERDAVDARVIQEFYDGTGSIGIGDNNRTGGHNVSKQRTWDIYESETAHPANYDTDKDGMPDDWERTYGLNPQDPNDHSGDLDGDGYTNIEEYLAIAAAC